jgi:hypothetical protein
MRAAMARRSGDELYLFCTVIVLFLFQFLVQTNVLLSPTVEICFGKKRISFLLEERLLYNT